GLDLIRRQLRREQGAAFIEAPLQADDQSKILPDAAIGAGQAYRLAQLRLGLTQLAGHGVGQPQIGVKRRLVRRDAERLLVVPAGLLVAPALVEDRPLDR